MMQVPAVSCTVRSVDRQAGTIVATDPDGLDYSDVRLRAVLEDDNGVGLLVYPVVGSQVVVSILDGIDTMTFVSQYSDIEEFVLTTAGGISLHLTKAGELHLNGNSLEGLVKAVELKEQLDKTNAVVDAIQQVFVATLPVPLWTPVQPDGINLKVAMTKALLLKKVGDFSDIQNQKVKHGE
ncbi:hypothetical protein D0T11_18620 [Hymenobacter rubripertinctus]|uniref:Uncharacterized protein n=2 Tax=Hymenobacter rubripertinctus TaxID=2029981 RepID=A0A418QMN2_9BACT|nr:hypothetical protein D0T11_18620 [Hymenobacter rubripertinctus]